MAAPVSQVDLDLILTKTRDLWCEMRNRRVFITGGTGFFGCWLTESFTHANRWLALDARATILTRDPQRVRAEMPPPGVSIQRSLCSLAMCGTSPTRRATSSM